MRSWSRAHKLVEAFNHSPSGLVVMDGELIELPVIRSMQRVLAVAQRIQATRAS